MGDSGEQSPCAERRKDEDAKEEQGHWRGKSQGGVWGPVRESKNAVFSREVRQDQS